jgi:murein DD-endopeptidase MepM/ murein hydrolase activator NlpD
MRVVWPLPPGKEANRVDAGFLDPGYPAARRRMGLAPDEHPGVDINLTGTSGDGDLRYPVVAVALGKVVHAKKHRVWGNVVLVESPDWLASALGYPYLAFQYAHLHDVLVKEGDYVYPGEPIGTIGKGDPARPFLAHLHFEVRVAKLPADHWPRTRDAITGKYIDPVAFLEKHTDYRRRYAFPAARLVTDTGTKLWIVNMEDPARVWLRGPPV